MSHNSHAQTQTILEQIEANKVYLEYLEKGYDIVKKGLNLISDIKNGEFNLHNDFFNSLKTINPYIKKGLTDIMMLGQKIIYNSNKMKLDKLVDETINDLTEVIRLTTNNEYGMKDDERLRRIDAIYKEMQENYGFVRRAVDQNKILSIQQLQEKQEIETSRKLYNIK